MFWSEKFIGELPITLQHHVRARQATLKMYATDVRKELPSDVKVSDDTIARYAAAVLSRAWGGIAGAAMPGPFVAPGIDLFNHDPTANVVALLADGPRLVAHKNYAPGEEVFDSYGPQSDDDLLAQYGFVDHIGNHTSIVMGIAMTFHRSKYPANVYENIKFLITGVLQHQVQETAEGVMVHFKLVLGYNGRIPPATMNVIRVSWGSRLAELDVARHQRGGFPREAQRVPHFVVPGGGPSVGVADTVPHRLGAERATPQARGLRQPHGAPLLG